MPGEGSGLVASALGGGQQVVLGNDRRQACRASGQASGCRPEGPLSGRLAPEGVEGGLRWVAWAPGKGSRA